MRWCEVLPFKCLLWWQQPWGLGFMVFPSPTSSISLKLGRAVKAAIFWGAKYRSGAKKKGEEGAMLGQFHWHCKCSRWHALYSCSVPGALGIGVLSVLTLGGTLILTHELNIVFGWHRQSRKVWREQRWGSVMLPFAILLQLQSAWSSWLCGFLNPYPKWGPNPKGSSKVRLFLRQLYVACGWRFWRRNFLMEQYWATAMLHLAFLL